MLATALLPLFLAPLAQAGTATSPDLTPRLERVTVYGGQALVERAFEVKADEKGGRLVTVGPFSLQAQSSSFQVKVLDGPAVVVGMDVGTEEGNPEGNKEREDLLQEISDLQARLRDKRADLASVDAGQSFVDSVWKAMGGAGGASAVATAAQDGGLDKLLEFVRTRCGELEKEKAGVTALLQDLDGRLAERNAQLEELEKRLRRRSYRATLKLQFEYPGTAHLALSYLVPGAYWRPTYDVRVAPDLTGVSVGLVAQVVQKTGEDWGDAWILLSTSSPSVGLAPPSLPSLSFTLGPVPADGMALEEGAGTAGEDPSVKAFADPIGPESLGPLSAESIPRFGLSTQFRLPERKTVPADGRPHRFTLRQVPLNVESERYVVPSRSNSAFLRARVTLTGDAPLLGGPGKVFLGPDYLGEASMPTLRPGESTTLNLGVDPNLTVEWEKVTDERAEPGWLASTVRVTRVYRATLRLSASALGAVDVLVEDTIPVSRDERLDVSPTQIHPEPLSDPSSQRLLEDRGLLRWRVRMAPGQSLNFRWGYVLAFDESLDPRLFQEDR